MPLLRKGRPQSSHKQKPFNEGVEASCIPVVHPFHSRVIDLLIWSPSLAFVKKLEPQAVHEKGKRGVGPIGERRWGGGLVRDGSGIDSALSKRFLGIAGVMG